MKREKGSFLMIAFLLEVFAFVHEMIKLLVPIMIFSFILSYSMPGCLFLRISVTTTYMMFVLVKQVIRYNIIGFDSKKINEVIRKSYNK